MNNKEKILLNFHIKSFEAGEDDEETILEYNVSEYFDRNIKFCDLVKFLGFKYMKPTYENISNPYYYLLYFYSTLWGEYFDMGSDFSYIEKVYPENIKLKLWKLDKQFNLSNKIFDLYICGPGIGGGGYCKGIRFFIHTNEKDIHHTPHIHCKYSGEEFRINLNDMSIIDKPFKNKTKTNLALKIVKRNKNDFLNYWNKAVLKGEYIKFNMIHYD